MKVIRAARARRALATCLAAVLAHGCAAPSAPTAPRGHAHNDYLHARPLLDALAAGFTSVEADVFLQGDALLVGHERWMLQPQRTLERLYLEPLRRRIHANGGSVYPGGGTFLLLVDIKADGAAVYRKLTALLADDRQLLTRFCDGRIEPGALTIVLSGDRPRALAAVDRDR